MKIKLLIDGKKGSSTLLEKHFDLVKHLLQKYPNALWRKIHAKNQIGYELDV
ncbi:MAG: hypothetical protein QW727_01350 [Candidatus Pacearchaeota archaeon]